MAAETPGSFRVDRIGFVDEQIRVLARRSADASIRPDYLKALKEILRRLTTTPVDWGDPERRTAHPGGVVFHGVVPPLFVQYVVYSAEQSVLILNIKPLPGSALDS